MIKILDKIKVKQKRILITFWIVVTFFIGYINQINLPDGVEIVPCSGLCFVTESLTLSDDGKVIETKYH